VGAKDRLFAAEHIQPVRQVGQYTGRTLSLRDTVVDNYPVRPLQHCRVQDFVAFLFASNHSEDRIINPADGATFSANACHALTDAEINATFRYSFVVGGAQMKTLPSKICVRERSPLLYAKRSTPSNSFLLSADPKEVPGKNFASLRKAESVNPFLPHAA
jgi:hypothetical protein